MILKYAAAADKNIMAVNLTIYAIVWHVVTVVVY